MDALETFNIKKHLESRGVTDKTNVFYSKDEATFPLYTITGIFCGVQFYRPLSDKKKRNDEHGKYMTVPVAGYTPIFGIDYLDMSKDYCFVQEGIFDALALINLGYNAVAILSFSNKQAFLQLRLLFKNLYSLTDPDSSGDKLGVKMNRYMKCPDGYDVGDLFKTNRSLLESMSSSFFK